MRLPLRATSFVPQASAMAPGEFRGPRLRHTVRPKGSLDWLLIYTVGGSGLYRFAGGEFCSRAHTMTLYRPGIFQDYRVSPDVKGWDLLYAHFLPKAEWGTLLRWPELSPGLMMLSLEKEPVLRRKITARLRDMVRLGTGIGPRRQAFAQNALEEALLWCDTVNPRQAGGQPDARVRRAADFLAGHLAEPFDETKLGQVAGLSPSRLRHLFRLQMGDPPRNFQERLRLNRARELLALSQQTIGEIAQELGFENPFYFTLRFKKETGESPRAYRQRITRR